jgi:hypothetical protein
MPVSLETGEPRKIGKYKSDKEKDQIVNETAGLFPFYAPKRYFPARSKRSL